MTQKKNIHRKNKNKKIKKDLQWPHQHRPGSLRELCPHWSSESWWGQRCSSSRSAQGSTSWRRHRGRHTCPTGRWRTWRCSWRPWPRLAPHRPENIRVWGSQSPPGLTTVKPSATTSCVSCSARHRCWRKLCRNSGSLCGHRRHRTGYPRYRGTRGTDLVTSRC